MFVNLYLSEFIRIKHKLLLLCSILIATDIIFNFSMPSGFGHISVIQEVVIGICTIICLAMYIVIPIYYTMQYIKKQEYFISYPIANIKKFLLILAITFTIIISFSIIVGILHQIILLAKSGFSTTLYMNQWRILHLGMLMVSKFITVKFIFSLLMGYIFAVLFLMNIVLMKWIKWLLIIGVPLYLWLIVDIGRILLDNHVPSVVLHDELAMFNYVSLFLGGYFLLLNITLAYAMYFRVCTLQLHSNKYLYSYMGILVAGFIVSPIVVCLIIRTF